MFEPHGRVSLKAACEQIIRGLEPKDGISYDVAVVEVEALTGEPVDRAELMGPMLQASEALLADGVAGVVNVAGSGWQRMSPTDMINHAGRRDRKARRQITWRANAAGAAPPDELSWQDRQRRDKFMAASVDIAGLEARRARRQRPLPPASGQ